MSPSIAVIRPDRQLEVIDENGARRWSTGPTPGLVWGAWSESTDEDKALYSWPVWSPDGGRIAAFRASGGRPELVVLHGDGIRTDLLLRLEDRIPIYAQWSPDGERLGVLYQTGERLGLSTVAADGSRSAELATGSPLFFTWASAAHLVAFVGDGERSRIGLFPGDGGPLERFPGVPSNFCAPVRAGGGIGYVAHHSGRLALWIADRASAREIEAVQGLVAFLPSPDGSRIARATARDERSDYGGLALIDLESGESTPLDTAPATAFAWVPTGDRLVLARTDRKTGWVGFSVLDLESGSERSLGDVRPTRDLRFYLRFFEQFAQSHPLIDPDGTTLVVPGVLAEATGGEGLWALPLDGGPSYHLGEGLLGVWGPAR